MTSSEQPHFTYEQINRGMVEHPAKLNPATSGEVIHNEGCGMGPSVCEYEKRWETHAISNRSSDSRDFACYVCYSCALYSCKYPERKCNVKKVADD